MSVSSSFVQGLSVTVQPLKALLSRVRSTAACGFPSWHTGSSDGSPCWRGFLNDSGNSPAGHSQTLQSLNRHNPSSGQKGQSHHNLAYQSRKNKQFQHIATNLTIINHKSPHSKRFTPSIITFSQPTDIKYLDLRREFSILNSQ